MRFGLNGLKAAVFGLYSAGDCLFYYWDDFSGGCGVNSCDPCKWAVASNCVGDREGVHLDYSWYANVGANLGGVLWLACDWGIY